VKNGNGFLLNLTQPILDHESGFIVNGTLVNIVVTEVPAAIVHLLLKDPTLATVKESGAVSNAITYFQDVSLNQEGAWLVTTPEGLFKTTFQVKFWNGGQPSTNSDTVTLFQNSTTFMEDYAQVLGGVTLPPIHVAHVEFRGSNRPSGSIYNCGPVSPIAYNAGPPGWTVGLAGIMTYVNMSYVAGEDVIVNYAIGLDQDLGPTSAGVTIGSYNDPNPDLSHLQVILLHHGYFDWIDSVGWMQEINLPFCHALPGFEAHYYAVGWT
jgi:hypothetical protein